MWCVVFDVEGAVVSETSVVRESIRMVEWCVYQYGALWSKERYECIVGMCCVSEILLRWY